MDHVVGIQFEAAHTVYRYHIYAKSNTKSNNWISYLFGDAFLQKVPSHDILMISDIYKKILAIIKQKYAAFMGSTNVFAWVAENSRNDKASVNLVLSIGPD